MAALSTQTAQLRRPASPLGLLRHALPKGGLLPDDVWRRRHRAIVAILALHAVVIAQLLDELARHLQPRSGTAADAQA